MATVNYMVHNVEAAVTFYTRHLGFQVAQRMGRTSNAVRKLWSRAIERLQQELDTPP